MPKYGKRIHKILLSVCLRLLKIHSKAISTAQMPRYRRKMLIFGGIGFLHFNMKIEDSKVDFKNCGAQNMWFV